MAKSTTPRKESATFRLEPQLKYMAEVASRVQKRNLTNYIEWAIEHSLEAVAMNNGKTLAELYGELWDVNEVDRFLKLAFYYPELMTYEEQEIFKVITDNFNYLKKEEDELSDSNISFSLGITRSYEDLGDISGEYNKPYLYFFSAKAIKDNWEDIKALKPFEEWGTQIQRNGIGGPPIRIKLKSSLSEEEEKEWDYPF